MYEVQTKQIGAMFQIYSLVTKYTLWFDKDSHTDI